MVFRERYEDSLLFKLCEYLPKQLAGDGELEKLPQLIESNSASRLIASVDTFSGRRAKLFLVDAPDDDDEDFFSKY